MTDLRPIMDNFKAASLNPGSTQRGFTVVELMAVVAMAAIFAIIGAPMLSDFVIQQSIRNASFELMSDLIYARSEAVKRNATVTMTKSDTWNKGWTVAAGGTTIRQHPALPPNITITMDSSSIDFFLNGRASSTANFLIDDTGGNSGIVARCVTVDPSGRPQSTEGSCS